MYKNRRDALHPYLPILFPHSRKLDLMGGDRPDARVVVPRVSLPAVQELTLTFWGPCALLEALSHAESDVFPALQTLNYTNNLVAAIPALSSAARRWPHLTSLILQTTYEEPLSGTRLLPTTREHTAQYAQSPRPSWIFRAISPV